MCLQVRGVQVCEVQLREVCGVHGVPQVREECGCRCVRCVGCMGCRRCVRSECTYASTYLMSASMACYYYDDGSRFWSPLSNVICTMHDTVATCPAVYPATLI